MHRARYHRTLDHIIADYLSDSHGSIDDTISELMAWHHKKMIESEKESEMVWVSDGAGGSMAIVPIGGLDVLFSITALPIQNVLGSFRLHIVGQPERQYHDPEVAKSEAEYIAMAMLYDHMESNEKP